MHACMYLVLRIKKGYFRVKPHAMNNNGNIWAMYKDNTKNIKNSKNSS